MAERLTDESLDGLERVAKSWAEYPTPHGFGLLAPEVLSLLTEVRERREAEKDDNDALAELNAIGDMSEEECNRELEAAGVDTSLWASSTMALVKACKERNAAMARSAELEACLRECAADEGGLFALGVRAEELACGSPEQQAVFETVCAIQDRARAALAKGGA